MPVFLLNAVSQGAMCMFFIHCSTKKAMTYHHLYRTRSLGLDALPCLGRAISALLPSRIRAELEDLGLVLRSGGTSSAPFCSHGHLDLGLRLFGLW